MPHELWTNRRAVIVRARPAFREWLLALRGWAPEGEFFERAARVYLIDRRRVPSTPEQFAERGTTDVEWEAQIPRVFEQELMMNTVEVTQWPDTSDVELFDRLFAWEIHGLTGDLGDSDFSAGESRYEPFCYCGLWDKDPELLRSQGVPEGFCGLCVECGEPGHTRAHPSKPVTLAWCDPHYAGLETDGPAQ